MHGTEVKTKKRTTEKTADMLVEGMPRTQLLVGVVAWIPGAAASQTDKEPVGTPNVF